MRTSADLHRRLYGTSMHPMDPAHPRWQVPGARYLDPRTVWPSRLQRAMNPNGFRAPSRRSRGVAPWDCSAWCFQRFPASWDFPEWQACKDACEEKWGKISAYPVPPPSPLQALAYRRTP